MNRCTTTTSLTFIRAVSAILTLCFVTLSCPLLAQENPVQNIRTFPLNAMRGALVVVQPPNVVMNGVADRLSPGARIRGTNNMLVMSSTLIGQPMLVNYVRDQGGLLQEIWILTSAEAALQLPSQLH